MPGGSRRWIGNTAFFVLAELAAVLLLANSDSIQNNWLNRASHDTIAAIGGWGESTRDYFSLRRQNDSLSRENLELARRLRILEEDRQYSRATEDLLNGRDSAFRYIPARIVKASRNSQRNYVTVDKGSADGVVPHSGIITTNGVVGIIEAVGEHYSHALSLMNTEMMVSARIGREGFAAPLEWDGVHSRRAIMKDLPRHLAINPGDTVWTSGYSGIFPAGIPLGVTGNSWETDGSVQEAEVHLFIDFGALRYVSIVENKNGSETE